MVNRLDIVQSAEEALHYLDHKLPDLILLDLNLGDSDGLDLLKIIRSRKKTSTVPIGILTVSSSLTDITKSFENKANFYLNKPLNLTQLLLYLKIQSNFGLAILTSKAER